MSQELSVVGKRLLRPDAPDKATGAAKYTGDMKLPGMLIGRVLKSPHAHAKVLDIDTSRAKALPGVKAVITMADVPQKPFNRNLLTLARPSKAEDKSRDEFIFNPKARFVGDAVAAVAAINDSIAEEALKVIRVEYEKLPAVFDPLEAMAPNAPRIHDYAERNIASHILYPFPKGDVEKGFEEADYIVEETFVTSKQKHCQLEPTACVANFDSGGRLVIRSPCQLMHLAKRQLADIFDMPEGMIRWLTPYIGGGFGQRLSLTNEPICVALASKAGRPVKLEDTREEDFLMRESRQPFIETGKLGVTKDGIIVALQSRLIADAGAYFTHSGLTTFVNMLNFMGLYRCPNLACEADVVYTNTPISGGMRGYGNPEAIFALEQLIDMAAEGIGMDPLEFRLKNIKREGEPSPSPSIPIESTALHECIRVGAERIDWKSKRATKKGGVKQRDVGMACNTCGSGAAPAFLEHANAFVKFNADGSANLVVSPCEMGTGILGVLAQIAAEELGLGSEDIHIVTGDTDITQFDIGSHASRSTYVIGNAVLRAAREAKEKLLERAAKLLEVPARELEVRNRRIFVPLHPDKGVSVAEIVRNAIYNFQGESLNISGRCSFDPGGSRPFLATFVEVEVDTETGQVKVLKVVMVPDCGRAINPTSLEGQLEGAAAQGIGYALTEDFVINTDSGVLISDNFATYRIPTTLYVPEIEVVLVEKPVPSGPFGARGAGELGMMGMAAAIANAIYNAVGVRIKTLPMTPEKILNALKTK